MRRDQAGPGSPQDSPDADGGSFCLRPVLPANQRAQCHEKVISPGATLHPGSKALKQLCSAHSNEPGLKCPEALSHTGFFFVSHMLHYLSNVGVVRFLLSDSQ